MNVEKTEGRTGSPPVIVPEGFKSILSPIQRESELFIGLMEESVLTNIQRENRLFCELEVIGVEHQVITSDPYASSQQVDTSYRRIYEFTGKMLNGNPQSQG